MIVAGRCPWSPATGVSASGLLGPRGFQASGPTLLANTIG
jgi:hypothetical protein